MTSMKPLAALILAFGLFLAAPANAQTGTPADAQGIVKNFYAALENTMKEGDALGFEGRFKKLEPTVKSSFNLPLMTRFAVGPSWTKATPEEQEKLIVAFSDFSVANYASRFPRYGGEKFDVTGEKPAAGGGIIVETKLTPNGSDPVTLN
ncbi:MAG: organic solvent ABC transporter, partial [Alphaproteobacteria bacterium]|nr:organic solvent ABC transporter [Alphaproteobacteria bacterium]